MKTRLLVILAVVVPLAACAATLTPKQRAAHAARVQAAALAPVTHINLVNNGFYAWHAINDHQVVAYLTPRRAYLLDLPPCPGLEQTPAIVITSRMGQISINFDTITTSLVGVPCPIKRIRPLDLEQLKASPTGTNMNVELEPRPSHDDTRHQS
jgi:hypothetical protein